MNMLIQKMKTICIDRTINLQIYSPIPGWTSLVGPLDFVGWTEVQPILAYVCTGTTIAALTSIAKTEYPLKTTPAIMKASAAYRTKVMTFRQLAYAASTLHDRDMASPSY